MQDPTQSCECSRETQVGNNVSTYILIVVVTANLNQSLDRKSVV